MLCDQLEAPGAIDRCLQFLGDLRTWSGPAVAELAWLARTAELRALAAWIG